MNLETLTDQELTDHHEAVLAELRRRELSLEPNDEEIQLVRKGKKMEAIMTYRSRTHACESRN